MSQLTRRSGGFSLIELMVVISLIGIVLAMGIPAFGKWVADARVRGTTETLVNSLRVAQATAVARNRVSMLAMTAGAPAYNATAVAPSAAPSNWFVSIVPLPGSDDTAATLGVVTSSTVSTQYNVALTSTAAVVCFNSTGQQTSQTAAQTGLSAACAPQPGSAPTVIAVSSTNATRKFQVLIFPGGQIRMCDALKTLSATVPDGCP